MFSRRQSEGIDQLLSCFDLVRQRAQDLGGFGMAPEGFSWLLLRACGHNAGGFERMKRLYGQLLAAEGVEPAQVRRFELAYGIAAPKQPPKQKQAQQQQQAQNARKLTLRKL